MRRLNKPKSLVSGLTSILVPATQKPPRSNVEEARRLQDRGVEDARERARAAASAARGGGRAGTLLAGAGTTAGVQAQRSRLLGGTR